jgi:hypothetical protein
MSGPSILFVRVKVEKLHFGSLDLLGFRFHRPSLPRASGGVDSAKNLAGMTNMGSFLRIIA